MIEVGKVFTIEITGYTSEGQGVGKVNDFTVFVNGAVRGEKVKAVIKKLYKNYAVADIREIIEKSMHRVEYPCSVYEKCGGCHLCHMSYEEQLYFKTQKVRDAISRIGKIEDVMVWNTLGMENPMGYRNKTQIPVGKKNGKVIFGFYEKGTHNIVDMRECFIQPVINNSILGVIGDFIEKFDIPVYEENTGKGLIRHVVIRNAFKTKEIMVVLVINDDDIPYKKELINNLTGISSDIKSIVLNINKKRTNVIMGDRCITIYGKDRIVDYIGGIKFYISPLSFFQVNPIQTEILYNKVLEYADLKGDEVVFDIYSGVGSIALYLSKKAKKVIGVESVHAAVEDAKENSKINKIDNAEFICGEAEKVLPELYKKGIRADVVIVDPPRKGCEEMVLETIADIKPEKVIYVSCNPSTLARDLRILEGYGFKTMEIQPVDMFPFTYHVECVAMINRN